MIVNCKYNSSCTRGCTHRLLLYTHSLFYCHGYSFRRSCLQRPRRRYPKAGPQQSARLVRWGLAPSAPFWWSCLSPARPSGWSALPAWLQARLVVWARGTQWRTLLGGDAWSTVLRGHALYRASLTEKRLLRIERSNETNGTTRQVKLGTKKCTWNWQHIILKVERRWSKMEYV